MKVSGKALFARFPFLRKQTDHRFGLSSNSNFVLLFSGTGAYDDPNGSHISIEVVSPLFEGKRPVQRQQLVYKAIWEELQGPVHAVDNMICKTPSE